MIAVDTQLGLESQIQSPVAALGSRAYSSLVDLHVIQVIKTFSIREGWWYIGIKGDIDGGVKSKGTRLLIEEK